MERKNILFYAFACLMFVAGSNGVVSAMKGDHESYRDRKYLRGDIEEIKEIREKYDKKLIRGARNELLNLDAAIKLAEGWEELLDGKVSYPKWKEEIESWKPWKEVYDAIERAEKSMPFWKKIDEARKVKIA